MNKKNQIRLQWSCRRGMLELDLILCELVLVLLDQPFLFLLDVAGALCLELLFTLLLNALGLVVTLTPKELEHGFMALSCFVFLHY